jgi:hypothetical protein
MAPHGVCSLAFFTNCVAQFIVGYVVVHMERVGPYMSHQSSHTLLMRFINPTFKIAPRVLEMSPKEPAAGVDAVVRT